MDTVLRDIRHAARNLARTPGFALITVVTLALGIGMALGADPSSVLQMVLGQGLTVAGVVIGLAVAVRSQDDGGGRGADGRRAAAACYLPARGATRVDPMIVLREE